MDNKIDYDPKVRYGVLGIIAVALIYVIFFQGQGSTWAMNIPAGTPLVLVASATGQTNFEHIPLGEEIKVRTTTLTYGSRLDDVRLQVTEPVRVLNGKYIVIAPGMILGARFDLDKQGNIVVSHVFLHTNRGYIPVKVNLQTDSKPFVQIMDFWETVGSKF